MRASTQEKRTRIIEVATELFIDQGYKDTSLDQIVAICGGSKQTLYRYFSNKEGLFIEVLEYNIKNSFDPVFQLDEIQNESLQLTLETFALNYLKKMCANPLVGLFRIICADFNKHSTIPQSFWETGPLRIHQNMIAFLKSDRVTHSLHIQDAELACAQLLSLIKLDYYSMALLGLALPDDEQLAKHVKKAVATFLKGYQKE